MPFIVGLLWGFAISIWVLVIVQNAAKGEEHSHPPQDIQIHERFYNTWMIPPLRQTSCCDQKDCYPTEFMLQGGTWFAMHRETGRFIAVPDSKLEHNTADPRDSPDGRGHLCANPQEVVFCAVLGSGT